MIKVRPVEWTTRHTPSPTLPHFRSPTASARRLEVTPDCQELPPLSICRLLSDFGRMFANRQEETLADYPVRNGRGLNRSPSVASWF